MQHKGCTTFLQRHSDGAATHRRGSYLASPIEDSMTMYQEHLLRISGSAPLVAARQALPLCSHWGYRAASTPHAETRPAQLRCRQEGCAPTPPTPGMPQQGPRRPPGRGADLPLAGRSSAATLVSPLHATAERCALKILHTQLDTA